MKILDLPLHRIWRACLAAGVLSVSLATQAQNTITNGLVAYWNFDDNLNDSFQHFDGTANGANPITFVAGKSGFTRAIQLDGVDQYVQITGGNPDDLAFADGSISIAGWFKVEAFDKSWQALVAQGEGSSWRVARNSSGSTMAYAGGLTDAAGVATVDDGNWHHFVAISDANGVDFGAALYIDGVQDAVQAGSAVLAVNGLRTMIGNNPGSTGRSWHGEIDDVAIWSRVLSEAEISTLYAGGAGKPLNAFLPAGQDTDKDGMPDAWEIKYGLNPNDASDAAKDANGNGISNLNEFLNGVDPLDTVKPTLTSVAGNSTFDKVIVTFSKPVDITTATNLANYAISPSLAITQAAVHNNVVTLSTAKQTPGAAAYALTVSNIEDVSNWPIPANSKATFYSFVLIKTGINSGLKAYWTFDGNLDDSVGIFNGTENGSSPIPFIDGKAGFGKAIQLDGVDQYVQITGGNPDDLAFAGANFSIAGWFKVEAFDKSWQALVAQGEGNSWRVARNGDNSTMAYAGGLSDGTGTTNVADGNWHHFVAISDSTGNAFGSALYIDGTRDATVAGKAVLAVNGQRTMIGNNPGSTARSWNGEIDDVAIWSRIISEAEISSLYNGGAGKPLSALTSSSVDIPTPAEGIFTTQTPGPNAKNVLPSTSITIVHADGKIVWGATNVTLKLNGVAVTPTFSRVGGDLTITYKPASLLSSGSVNTVSLGVLDPAGNPTTIDWSFTVSSYPTLTKAQQALSVDTNKPGFLWRVFQNESTTPSSVASTEEALAGVLKASDGTTVPNLADASASGVATGPGTTVGSLIQFEIPTVINLSRSGTDNAGDWTTDDVMPGIPGTSGGTDGIDAEIIAFVELPAGAITMGVNSDDGFRSQAAYINKPADGLLLGEYDGARGVADTLFVFVVQDAGIYPIRTIYQNATGGADMEIFTVKADGTKVLLNDSANGGFKTYRVGTAPNKPTTFSIGIQGGPSNIAITWTQSGLILQKSADLRAWSDVPSATSPYKPTATGTQFYRLKQ